jgi:hypothetical protein
MGAKANGERMPRKEQGTDHIYFQRIAFLLCWSKKIKRGLSPIFHFTIKNRDTTLFTISVGALSPSLYLRENVVCPLFFQA